MGIGTSDMSPSCIISERFTETPSLIGSYYLCPFPGGALQALIVVIPSKQACRNQETPLLPLPLCWHNMQPLVIGTFIYQMVIKFKGGKCWAILDTCNTLVY